MLSASFPINACAERPRRSILPAAVERTRPYDGLLASELGEERLEQGCAWACAYPADRSRPERVPRNLVDLAARPRPRRSSGRCWPPCRTAWRRTGSTATGAISTALAKSATVISGRFSRPTPFRTSLGLHVVRPGGAQHVEQVLGVAQVGEIGRGHDHHLVGADQGAAAPGRPVMRNVEHDAGHGGAQDVEQRVEGRLAEIIGPVERRRRGQDATACRCIWTAAGRPGCCRAGRARRPLRRCPAADPG